MLTYPRFMPVTHRCHGCKEMAETGERVPKEEKGIYVGLKPATPEDWEALWDQVDEEESMMDEEVDEDEHA